MVPQTTKFSYVYDELKQRITDGQILPGSRLPSSRRLCDEFQVSLYTINNVLDALKEEGLIENQPRLAPRVLEKGYASSGEYGAEYIETKG